MKPQVFIVSIALALQWSTPSYGETRVQDVTNEDLHELSLALLEEDPVAVKLVDRDKGTCRTIPPTLKQRNAVFFRTENYAESHEFNIQSGNLIYGSDFAKLEFKGGGVSEDFIRSCPVELDPAHAAVSQIVIDTSSSDTLAWRTVLKRPLCYSFMIAEDCSYYCVNSHDLETVIYEFVRDDARGEAYLAQTGIVGCDAP